MKSNVIASMVIEQPGSERMTVEVRRDAGFTSFYHFFRGRGRGRKPARVAHRNETGFDALARQFADAHIKITYRNKSLYRKLLACSPDDLPGGGPVRARVDWRRFLGVQYAR